MRAFSGQESARAKEEISAQALRGGALVVGVASAESFGEALGEADGDIAGGARPEDLLPGARSVLVVGGAPPRAGDWACTVPGHLETMGTGDRINSLGLKLAKFIEEHHGYYALLVPPGLNKGNRPFLSIAMAAELAGCGSPSLAGPVLHSDYGFMYYSAIVTTLPLEPDPPPERAACPAPACLDQWETEGTTPCMQVCPIGDGGCLGGKIEEGRIREREYDSARCNARVHTYWVPGFQKALEAALEQTDKEKRKMILYGNFFTRTLWSITYAAQSQGQCLECMRVCPVGAEYRNLK